MCNFEAAKWRRNCRRAADYVLFVRSNITRRIEPGSTRAADIPCRTDYKPIILRKVSIFLLFIKFNFSRSSLDIGNSGIKNE